MIKCKIFEGRGNLAVQDVEFAFNRWLAEHSAAILHEIHPVFAGPMLFTLTVVYTEDERVEMPRAQSTGSLGPLPELEVTRWN